MSFLFLKYVVAYIGFVHGSGALSGVIWVDRGFGKIKEEETILMSWVMRSAFDRQGFV